MKVESRLGAGCMLLFAMPFAGVAIGALVWLVRSVTAGEPAQRVFGIGAFALGFAATTAALIGGAIWGLKRAAETSRLQARHPGEPWMWNVEWASRRIHDQNRPAMVLLWLFAILWNATAAPVLFFLPRAIATQNYIGFVALIFPLVGLGIIIAAVRMTMRALRFRRSALVLTDLPVPLGGAFRGRVEVPYAPLAEAVSITVKFAAIYRYRSGKSTHEKVLWQDEREIARGAIGRTPEGVSIPIAMDVPAHLPQTNDDAFHQHLWRLTVKGEVPGIDDAATFEVPVFDTAAAR
ncbi:MAG TPA: hypothetical protein VE010_17910 [Thermoanaerobaculia bacterium]|nr:hypothetical protein [Thermoanaerobaculia bacterium]